MGRMLHCSWCERADAYGAVSWVSLGDNAGDKAVGKVLRVVEIVHLSVDYPPKMCGEECVGVRDAEASCRGWKSNL